jgi:nicotinate-nucleotide pyrophosphorylase (carboxylating)
MSKILIKKLPEITKLIKAALDEDLGKGDLTSNLIIKDQQPIKFQISNRQEIILCGADIVLMVFEEIAQRFNNKNLIISKKMTDGAKLKKNSPIIVGKWDAKPLFAAERVALNLIQHLSGIASETSKYVALVGKKTKILDTRKTIPCLRILQKYAVRVGGGYNHRFGLDDGILIKDNHIAAAGGATQAIELARKNRPAKMKIEIECDHISQVKAALQAKADIIMLDNMNLKQIKQAIALINGQCQIEVSGGVNLKNIKAFAQIGIDYISVGALTHSVQAADIGLDII